MTVHAFFSIPGTIFYHQTHNLFYEVTLFYLQNHEMVFIFFIVILFHTCMQRDIGMWSFFCLLSVGNTAKITTSRWYLAVSDYVYCLRIIHVTKNDF